MSHISTQPHKCTKCGHEQTYSPDEGPVLLSTRGGSPYCPLCLEAFLRSHVGILACTVDWGFGSDYDREMRAATTAKTTLSKIPERNLLTAGKLSSTFCITT